NQPKKGRAISSFFITMQGSSRRTKGTMTSSIPWCLAAIRAAPDGRFPRPRNSTRTSQIQRRPNSTNFAHQRMTVIASRRDISRAGDRPTANTAIDRYSQAVKTSERRVVTSGGLFFHLRGRGPRRRRLVREPAETGAAQGGEILQVLQRHAPRRHRRPPPAP